MMVARKCKFVDVVDIVALNIFCSDCFLRVVVRVLRRWFFLVDAAPRELLFKSLTTEGEREQ